MDLSHEEKIRYSRHLLLREIGVEGQQKLKEARVLIVGAGGLGSPAAIYLAECGIGTLGLIDDDVVSISNLHRQPLHGTHNVGMSKIDSARQLLHSFNPHVSLELTHQRLTSQNALDLFAGFDLVIDGTDNFPTRYLINDACALLHKPDIYGSVYRFEGQVGVFDARNGPCYRCLHPLPPPFDLVPSCAESGVLGVLPGIIGSLQALEAIKLITGIGEVLKGRLLYFDGLSLTFFATELSKNPDCILCGPTPQLQGLIDYDTWCHPSPDRSHLIDPVELQRRLTLKENLILLDVREPFEYDLVNLKGRLIPLGQLSRSLSALDPTGEIVVYCKSGLRSMQAVTMLKANGFQRVKSLLGGIDAWIDLIDPSLSKY